MLRQITSILTKNIAFAQRSHFISCNSILKKKLNVANRISLTIPQYSFCLIKQLEGVSKNIFKRKQIEYEQVLNFYSKEELEKLELPQIVECIVVISQYYKMVNSLDLSHKKQIKEGILAFLNCLKKNNLKLQDYFELIASNYFLLSHKQIKNHIQPIWKEQSATIDSLDINEQIKLLYLYQTPYLYEESNSDAPYPHSDEIVDILSRNASKYLQQLSCLSPDLAVYLCILLKHTVQHIKESQGVITKDLEQLIDQLTQKITEDINYYSPQKLYLIMDHVSFLAGQEYFEQICIYFEKRLIEQDKLLQMVIESNEQEKEVIDFSKVVQNKQPLYINQWLDMCVDTYNQGRQNIELFEYVKQKLNDPTRYDLKTLNCNYIPTIFFIFAKSNILDAATVVFYKQYILENLPNYTNEQLAKIYFSFSYTKMLDDLLFDNIIYYFEQHPLDSNSLGIIFFSLATINDQYSDRMVELLHEDRIIYVLEAEDETCDSQFLLSFLYFIVKKNQLHNTMYQGYIFEKFKEWNLGSPEDIQTLLLNVLKILNENPEDVKANLSQAFKDYLVSTFKLNRVDMDDNVAHELQGYLSGIDLKIE